MTRDEHLAFCKKCTKSKFDPQQGLICGITNAIADFDPVCENFEENPHAKAVAPSYQETDGEVVTVLSDEISSKLRPYQDLSYGIIGGTMAALFSALIWAAITVATEYQIGYMAIVVGLVVGLSVRFFGAGIDPIFSFIGAVLSLVSCLLGNLFSQIGFIAQMEGIGYFETLTFLNLDIIISIYAESFSPIDLLFYGIATYEGFKFSTRAITIELAHSIEKEDFVPIPPGAKLRLPMVAISIVIFGLIAYRLSQGTTGYQKFHDEHGNLYSEGQMVNSKENGEWIYYYPDGEKRLMATYEDGLENGRFEWYTSDGKVTEVGNYQNGLKHGFWLTYYPNGEVFDSVGYEADRMQGLFIKKYISGSIMQKGTYSRDRHAGQWVSYHENGQKESQGNFEEGIQTGMWEFWNDQGTKLQDIDYNSDTTFRIVNYWNEEGKQLIANGNGKLIEYYPNGNKQTIGQLKDGYKVGLWTYFFSNGKKMEEIKFENNSPLIMYSWAESGSSEVVNGNGSYTSYYQSGSDFEQGQVSEGKRIGAWKTFYDVSNNVSQTVNYKNGKPHGLVMNYYESGLLAIEGEFINGKETGTWNWYYESGLLHCKAIFKNGLKEGTQEFWSETGRLCKEEVYEGGQLVSEQML